MKRGINLGVRDRLERLSVGGLSHLVAYGCRLRRSRPRGQRVVVVEPGSWGSIGDEAMTRALVRGIHNRNQAAEVTLMVPGQVRGWDSIDGVQAVTCIEDYLARWAPSRLLRLAISLSGFDELYILGADVMDGYYGEARCLRRHAIARLAGAMGLDTTIVGFSVSEAASSRCLESLGRLGKSARICCRDEVSRERLAPYAKSITVTADMAFLLEPDEQSEVVRSVGAWARGEREAGRMVIGLNINRQLVHSLPGIGLLPFVEIVAAEVNSFAAGYAGGVSVVFVPHDLRGDESDVRCGAELVRLLDSDVRAHSLLVKGEDVSARKIKALAGELDMVLTGRMHLAIAALGRGVVAACVEYAGKFEGLLRHFDLEGMSLTPEEVVKPGRLSEFMLGVAGRREELRARIEKALPAVLSRAEANLRGARLSRIERRDESGRAGAALSEERPREMGGGMAAREP